MKGELCFYNVVHSWSSSATFFDRKKNSSSIEQQRLSILLLLDQRYYPRFKCRKKTLIYLVGKTINISVPVTVVPKFNYLRLRLKYFIVGSCLRVYPIPRSFDWLQHLLPLPLFLLPSSNLTRFIIFIVKINAFFSSPPIVNFNAF